MFSRLWLVWSRTQIRTTRGGTYSLNHSLTLLLTHSLTHSYSDIIQYASYLRDFLHKMRRFINDGNDSDEIVAESMKLMGDLTHYENFEGSRPSYRPLTHSLTRSVTHLLTDSLILSLTHWLTHSVTHSFTHSLTHPLTHPLTHSPSYSLTYLLLFTHSLTRSLTHSLTHLLTQGLFYYLLACLPHINDTMNGWQFGSPHGKELIIIQLGTWRGWRCSLGHVNSLNLLIGILWKTIYLPKVGNWWNCQWVGL